MMHSIFRISVLVAASYAAVSVSSLGPARACSFVELEEHTVDADEEAVDTTPPQAPVLGEVVINRSPEGGGCMSATSCDGSGWLGFDITASADDRTPQAQMGYVIELADGELPGNMNLPAGPVRADAGGHIGFPFSDRDQDIDFTLSVRAMDLGGNLGEPVMVQVRDSGSSGCSAGGRSGPVTLILVMLALAAALRRRRDLLRA